MSVWLPGSEINGCPLSLLLAQVQAEASWEARAEVMDPLTIAAFVVSGAVAVLALWWGIGGMR